MARQRRGSWRLIAAVLCATLLGARLGGRAFAVNPVPLLVAFSANKHFAAVSLGGESGCPATPASLLKELERWMESTGSYPRLDVTGKPTAYRTLGYGHVRNKLGGYWKDGRLLVSCYEALSWLRRGEEPSSEIKPPDADDVRRGMERVTERASCEASDTELRRWVAKEYGAAGLEHLLAAAQDEGNTSLLVLKEFFTWFRDDFPYYRGACKSCQNSTDCLGLVRPGDRERKEGGAGVSEVYFCTGCNVTTFFPRFRTVRPVLGAHRGRCGEYSWVALRLLEALGFGARWVDNYAGHVWVEAFAAGRWVHIDPCEAAVDEPLLYATGWGRCPVHVLAYQAVGSEVTITDVTASYRPADAGAIPEETRRKVTEAVAEALAHPDRKSVV